MITAWRKPPPIRCLSHRAPAMKSFGPTRQEPTGAPEAFEKHTLAESKGAAYSASLTPVAAARATASRYRTGTVARTLTEP
jgi:hypothetical protein